MPKTTMIAIQIIVVSFTLSLAKIIPNFLKSKFLGHYFHADLGVPMLWSSRVCIMERAALP